ncbi:MAG: hypothetical protein K2Y37_11600 [Pirellulales bacterium]|nr:hypothetical protein [Pirellulales bacterium]
MSAPIRLPLKTELEMPVCFIRCTLLGTLLYVSLVSAGQISAEILTFDDIGLLDHKPVPNGYGGLQWNNMYYINGGTYYIRPSGYLYGTVSGNYTALNWFANPAEVFAATPFNFKGAYLTAAWNDGLYIAVTGYRAGALTHSQLVVVPTYMPTFFDFNFGGVDRVRFEAWGGVGHNYGGTGAYFAMDNFTFTAVPEPSTAAQISSAVAAAIFVGYRRRARSSTRAKGVI